MIRQGGSRGAKEDNKSTNSSPWNSAAKKSRRRNRKIDPNKQKVDSSPVQPRVIRPKSAGLPGRRLKLPKTAAVSITGRTNDFSYKDALMKARREISLTDLKIEQTRLRRAANGRYLGGGVPNRNPRFRWS